VSISGFILVSGLAVGLVLALTAWAAYLVFALARQRRRGDASKRAASRDQARSSIAVLARGALDDQIDLTEAAIRIATLLDYLDIEPEARERFAPIYALSEDTAYIPRLQQWQALTALQRREYRRQKQQLEQRHIEALRSSLEQLLTAID
jgi:hypothetical protein